MCILFFPIGLHSFLYYVVPKILALCGRELVSFLTESFRHDLDCDRVRASVLRDSHAYEGDQRKQCEGKAVGGRKQ